MHTASTIYMKIKQDYLIEILMECKKEGNPDMVYKFSFTFQDQLPRLRYRSNRCIRCKPG